MIYRYVAFNRQGKEQKGIVDASSPAAARKALRSKGLFVRELKQDSEKRERDLFPGLSKLLYRVPRRDVGLFSRQLGTLLDAGLPLDRSLANIIEQTENEYLKKALIEIRADVIEGDRLSDAMSKHPTIFPPVYHNLVSVGEKTGTYDQALLRLAELEDANQKIRGKVLTAMFYPIIMLVLLGGIVSILMLFVLPQIKKLYETMDADLPLITQIVIGSSDFVSSVYVLIPIGLVGVGIFLLQRWRKTDEGRRRWERLILRQPLLGNVRRKFIVTSFSRNLGVMLLSRVPLITALQVAAKVVDHHVFGDEIQSAIEKIKEGARISDAFRESIVMTQMVVGMLSAGEISDTVPEMVNKIADIMDNELDATIERFSTLLEPVMIVVMGAIIAVIMLAILLPMMQLTQNLQ